MPYIKAADRSKYDDAIKALVAVVRAAPPGELNYVITKIATAWLDSIGPVGYTELACLVGTLETLKLELVRRCLDPYEDRKRKENGDVFHA